MNAPSAKTEGFSLSGPSAGSHTQCVARAFSNLTHAMHPQGGRGKYRVDEEFKTSGLYPRPKGLGFTPSEIKRPLAETRGTNRMNCLVSEHQQFYLTADKNQLKVNSR